jgi:hypothetical protein
VLIFNLLPEFWNTLLPPSSTLVTDYCNTTSYSLATLRKIQITQTARCCVQKDCNLHTVMLSFSFLYAENLSAVIFTTRKHTESLRAVLFWVITQRVVVFFYRRFGTSNMGPIGCHETSVGNCQYSLLSDPEERSSDLLSGGNLKSHTERLLEP